MIQEKEILQLKSLLTLIYDLQQEPWSHQDISRKEAFDIIVRIDELLGAKIDPNNPEFLPLMAVIIAEISSQPTDQEAPSLPPNLNELVEIYEKDEEKKEEEKAVELQKKITSQENYNRYQKFKNNFKEIILKTDSKIPQKLAEKMAQNAADKVISSLPPVAQADFFTEEVKNQVLEEAEKIVNEEFQKIKQEGVLEEAEKIVNEEFEKIKQETTKGKVQNLITKAQEIAATPKITRPFQEVTKITSSVLDETLPQAILDQLAKNDGVAFLPLYTVLYPKAAAALIERGIYTLPANLLKLAAEEATPEWQAMIKQGVFTEDFQVSIKYLREIGIPEKHPLLLKLTDKAARFREQQKIEYRDKKGNVFYKDKPAVEILKHYYHFSKATGRQKIYDDDLKTNLPRLSPNTDWARGGYSGLIKKVLSRFRFFTKGSEKFSKFITKGQYTSLFTPVKQFISKRFAQPVVQWLAKTAIGKAAKAGVKKAAGWLAVKLGVKMGIRAAAVAAAPESAGISLLIGLAIEAGTWLLGKIKNVITSLIRDPEKALMAIGIGIIALVFIPNPFNLFGIIPIVFGGLGLASFIMAPIALTAAGAGIGGFFTALAAAPIIFPVALFLITVLGTMAVLTLFIVLVVSGSFSLPTKIAETTMTNVSAYESPYFKLEKTASPTEIKNEELSNGKEIQYTVTIQAEDGYNLNINDIKDNFSFSTDGKQLTLPVYSFTEDLNEKGRKVDSGGTWQVDYTTQVDSRFENTAIINTVNVELTVQALDENEKTPGTFPGTASVAVIIGKPPMECPSGWPIYLSESPSSRISQGPGGSYSHISKWTGKDKEAVDITAPLGTPVHATHQGTVIEASMSDTNGGKGRYVKIKGFCEGKDFSSEYLHLDSVSVTVGDIVVLGSIIGEVDSSGTSTGNHLDYRFNNLLMQPRFIPKDVRKCNSCYSTL